MPIRIAIVDEHEIFRRGLVACLSEDSSLEVVVERAAGPVGEETDIVLASAEAVRRERFDPPVLVCGRSSPENSKAADNNVIGFLPRSGLTAEQVTAAVRAGAAGLTVGGTSETPTGGRALDDRRLQVLQLLADGASTQEISKTLRYSERTIKNLIQEVTRELGARSRAHAVAEGIRRGII